MKPLVMITCTLLAACSESEEARQGEEHQTVFDPLTQQVDQAKAVEETVEQRKRELDEALKKAEERDEPL